MINIIGLKHVKSTIEGRIKLDDNSKAMGGAGKSDVYLCI